MRTVDAIRMRAPASRVLEAAVDVVVSFEVIEHLLEPRALLGGARSALVRGGALFISTPYHGLVKNMAVAAL